jgi:LysR family glycine cleavage system transcriptional activator
MSSPSLRSLRALAEVSRTGSAAAAASHLGITASAVSHLLADLERQLGGSIFVHRRGAELNETGKKLAHSLDAAFASIDQAVADARRPSSAIRLSTLSSFALLWLIPRLERLRRILPAVDILISTDTRVVDLAHEPFDCAIRWLPSSRELPGLESTILFHEQLIQVASPRLTGAEGSLPRLLARSRPDDWAFFDETPRIKGATMFETRGQMIEAAIAGLGVAVIDRHLVTGALAAGHLRRIGDCQIERPEAYAFVARRAALESPPIRVLRKWLVEEAKLAEG